MFRNGIKFRLRSEAEADPESVFVIHTRSFPNWLRGNDRSLPYVIRDAPGIALPDDHGA